MHMEKLKTPVVMATLIGALLAIIGALMGWFTIDNSLANSLVGSDLDDKENTVLIIAVIVAALTKIAAWQGKKMLAIVGVILGLFAALVVFNQLPTSEEAELLEVTTNMGYWLSLLGSLVMALGSIGILAKGLGAPMAEKPKMDEKEQE